MGLALCAGGAALPAVRGFDWTGAPLMSYELFSRMAGAAPRARALGRQGRAFAGELASSAAA